MKGKAKERERDFPSNFSLFYPTMFFSFFLFSLFNPFRFFSKSKISSLLSLSPFPLSISFHRLLLREFPFMFLFGPVPPCAFENTMSEFRVVPKSITAGNVNSSNTEHAIVFRTRKLYQLLSHHRFL